MVSQVEWGINRQKPLPWAGPFMMSEKCISTRMKETSVSVPRKRFSLAVKSDEVLKQERNSLMPAKR
jgi:hypothetical protein